MSRTGGMPLLAACLLGALAGLTAAARAGEGEAPPCGIAPRAKPKRIKGGEGVPPLPLPATPLRRSERKRDPAPPLLVGKLRWGRRDLTWKLPDGREIKYGDWNHDPNDIHGLLEALAREIKVKYRAVEMDLAGFSFEAAETPVLYAAGLKPFTLSPQERGLLKAYLERGGFFLAVAHHGSRAFADSIREEASRLFPDRPFGLLPPDHPIYRAHRKLGQVSYTPAVTDRPERAPWLEGLYVGCRSAMVLSPYDLCCTWDSDHLPDVEPGVKGPDAFAIGVNILAYAIAFYPIGKAHAGWSQVDVVDPEIDRGDFVLAQVRHSGHHDPHPWAAAGLLQDALALTNLGARLERKVVSLASPDLGAFPFLYMTGHDDFRLRAEERSGLARFLASGGFLLADSCCGSLGFDVAFRREMAAVLPDAKLEVLPLDHPIFSAWEPVGKVEYTTAVRASFPDLDAPVLEGIQADGALRVVYSRFDIGSGWDGGERPFSLAVKPADALRLGRNVLIHAMTH